MIPTGALARVAAADSRSPSAARAAVGLEVGAVEAAVDPREEAGLRSGRVRRVRPSNSASKVRAMPMPSSCIGKPS